MDGENEEQQQEQEARTTPANPSESGQSPENPGQTPTPAPENPQRQDWRDRRISELTGKLRQTQSELAAARQSPNPPDPNPNPASPPPPAAGLSQADVDRLANERAGQISAQREFDRACNEVAQAGNVQFPDFQTRVSSLRGLVNPSDPNEAAAYNMFLTAAIDTGEGARILHHLGGDLNEAQRILSLSPTKMAAELTRLSMKPELELSSVSKPIKPVVGGRQAAHTAISPDDPEKSDGLSTAEWMRRRNEQVSKKNEAAQA